MNTHKIPANEAEHLAISRAISQAVEVMLNAVDRQHEADLEAGKPVKAIVASQEVINGVIRKVELALIQEGIGLKDFESFSWPKKAIWVAGAIHGTVLGTVAPLIAGVYGADAYMSGKAAGHGEAKRLVEGLYAESTTRILEVKERLTESLPTRPVAEPAS